MLARDSGPVDMRSGAFALGLDFAQGQSEASLLHGLFSTRARQVTGEMAKADAASYLSGLVIGSDVGGIPEMVVDQETGILVTPKSPEKFAEAIDRLLSDHGLSERLGDAGRRRCESLFSLDAHVAAVVNQYDAVLGRAGVLSA